MLRVKLFIKQSFVKFKITLSILH